MTAVSTPEQAHLYEMSEHQGLQGWDDKVNSSVTVLTKEVEEEPSSNSNASIHWEPGVTARFPWLGFGALVVILVSVAMTIFIMQSSNRKTQDEWPAYEHFAFIKETWRAQINFKPSVGLAICNTISNVALAIAIGQGISIAWWRKAMNGATVADLHKSWSFSASVLDLLVAGKNFNLIALAALTAKIALLDSVLLQQAASNNPGTGDRLSASIRIPIVQTIPNNYTGVWSRQGNVGQFSRNFSLSLWGYSSAGDLIIPETPEVDVPFDNRCNGNCFAQVEGFGWNISCTTDDSLSSGGNVYHVTPQGVINNTAIWNRGDTVNSNTTLTTLLSLYAQQKLFGDDNTTEASSFILFTSWADLQPDYGPAGNTDAENCTSRVLSQTCSFQPAKVLYPVEIINNQDETWKSAGNGYRLTSPWWVETTPEDNSTNIAESYGILKNGQINGIKVLETLKYDPGFDSNIQSFAWIQFRSGRIGSFRYLVDASHFNRSFDATYNPRSCVIPIQNPSTYIMSQINSISLRLGIEMAINAVSALGQADAKALHTTKLSTQPFVHDVDGKNEYPTIYYITSWPWLFAAIASLLFCVLCVLPSYWGFWKLGRKVTLGPMEIASAFQAPVLHHPAVASGGEVGVLLKEVGAKKVRYGEVEGRLGLGEPETVKKLWKKDSNMRH